MFGHYSWISLELDLKNTIRKTNNIPILQPEREDLDLAADEVPGRLPQPASAARQDEQVVSLFFSNLSLAQAPRITVALVMKQLSFAYKAGLS